MLKKLFICDGIPTLRPELHLLSVAGDQVTSLFGRCDMPHQSDRFQFAHLLMEMQGNGEKQIIIFTAIQCYGRHIHIECLRHRRGLVIDWDTLLKELAAERSIIEVGIIPFSSNS